MGELGCCQLGKKKTFWGLEDPPMLRRYTKNKNILLLFHFGFIVYCNQPVKAMNRENHSTVQTNTVREAKK